jgi:hypothetical protein
MRSFASLRTPSASANALSSLTVKRGESINRPLSMPALG